MNIVKRLLIFFLLIKNVFCIGLDELEDVKANFISSVTVYKSRAFLALPRSMCPNNKSTPTLIETHWDGAYGDIFSRFFHKITRHKVLASQVWGDCSSIQDAVSLSVEPLKPKLWILDKGNDFCSSKVLSYSLVFNQIADKTELITIDGQNLNVMVIDPVTREDFGYKAYIGQAEENVLLVFSLRKLVWWKINLIESSTSAVSVKADYLAICKVNSDLFISSSNGLEVFTLNLKQLRKMEEPHTTELEDVTLSFNVTLLGEKLGPSSGLVTDFDSGLIYFMKRDYAIVRWTIGFPMEAEHHAVLAQSYKSFPYIPGYFMDPENSIWAIVNPSCPDDCNNLNKNSHYALELKSRAVRLIKYEKFTEDMKFDQIVQDD